MLISQAKTIRSGVPAVCAGLAIAFSAAGEVHVYLDQGAYESALVSSTVVDFEGVPYGELIVRPAGHDWGGLVAGVTMYQIDADIQQALQSLRQPGGVNPLLVAHVQQCQPLAVKRVLGDGDLDRQAQLRRFLTGNA